MFMESQADARLVSYLTMARPHRTPSLGACYYAMRQGLARQAIFGADVYRHRFLAIIGKRCNLFETECHAYCLIDIRYPPFWHTPRGNLSRCVRYVGGSCACASAKALTARCPIESAPLQLKRRLAACKN